MKIYQSLKPQGLALFIIFIIVISIIMTALFGGLALLTPELILLLTEFAFIMYGFVFGRTHLNYCAPETHGYKYFRSIPNFESHFRKQCIISDIICYAIGYVITIINFIFMPDMAITPMIGIIYLFATALGSLITAFVNTSHRAYVYTMMFSTVPLVCCAMVFLMADGVPKDLVPVNLQLIILGCVTVFAAVALILFYKRLGKNLRTSYGKG